MFLSSLNIYDVDDDDDDDDGDDDDERLNYSITLNRWIQLAKARTGSSIRQECALQGRS